MHNARGRVSAGAFATTVRKQLVKTHGQEWAQKGRQERQAWARRANHVRDIRIAENKRDIREQVHRLRTLEAQESIDVVRRGKSLKISSCSWSDSTKVSFDEFFLPDVWTDAHVQKLRELAAVPVGPPPREQLARLQSMPRSAGVDAAVEQPDWLPWMCEHRSHFRGCMLKLVQDGGEDAFFKFAFAVQSPSLVCLVQARLLPEVPEREQSPASFFGGHDIVWQHQFELTWNVRFSDDGIFSGCEVHVIGELMYLAGGSLVSNDAWQPLASLEAVLPRKPPSRHKPKDEEEEEVDVAPKDWWHYPAMWEFLTEPAVTNTKKRVRTKAPRPPPAAGGGLDGAGMDGEAAAEAFLLRRAELGDDLGAEWREFFRWQLRGGRWTGMHKGIAFDCILASAIRGTEAHVFMSSFVGLNVSASFSLTAYGEEQALILARAWIGKAYAWFRVWQEAGSKLDHEFKAEDLASYAEPADSRALAVEAKGGLAGRVQQIRKMFPV